MKQVVLTAITRQRGAIVPLELLVDGGVLITNLHDVALQKVKLQHEVSEDVEVVSIQYRVRSQA